MVDWFWLKKAGWPYSKAQTARLEQNEILRSSGSRRKGTYREWLIPNPKPFPRRVKFGGVRHSPPVWHYEEVMAYFEACGLKVNSGL
jgi:hypothetical protein